MANWEEIRQKAKQAASKAAQKTEEIASMAAMQIKLKSLESKRNAQYQLLGKLTYRQLKSGESQAEKIAPVVEELDSLIEQIRAQVIEIEQEKKAREEKAEQETTEDNTENK